MRQFHISRSQKKLFTQKHLGIFATGEDFRFGALTLDFLVAKKFENKIEIHTSFSREIIQFDSTQK